MQLIRRTLLAIRDSRFIFLLLLIVTSMFFGFGNIIQKGPQSFHAWRQTDGLSIAQNYLEEGFDFFHPSLHFLGEFEGKGVGEFPIVYYVNALIWEVAGHNWLSPRILTILMVFIGLFALRAMIMRLIEDKFISSLLTLILYASPLLAYYTNNFLVNVPALAMIFIAWYHSLVYYQESRYRSLFWASCFFTVAILFRSTMMIGIIPLFFVWLRRILNQIIRNRDIRISMRIKELALLLLPIVVSGLWYIYAKGYNTQHEANYFLMSLRPLWEAEPEMIRDIWNNLITQSLYQIYPIPFLILIPLLIPAILIIGKHRHIQWFLLLFIPLLISSALYFVLWFMNIDVHHYYLFEFYMPIGFLLIATVVILAEKYPGILKKPLTRFIIILIFVVLGLYTAVNNRSWTNNQDPWNRYDFWTPKTKKSQDEFTVWDRRNIFSSLKEARPWLRELGVERTDTVLSIPDQSPCITLYLMDVKGYTQLYMPDKTVQEQIEYAKSMGADYLMIQNKDLLKDTAVQKLSDNFIGQRKMLTVFRLE